MTHALRPRRHKKLYTIAGIIVIVGFLGIRKGIQFAAAPSREKECDFIYPPEDPTKPTTISIEPASVPFEFEQFGGTINDASCLNQTNVYGIAQISTIDDVRNALQYARDNGLKVTPAGERHSMGGQSFAKMALVLDMRGYNKMQLHPETQTLTVESGAKWADIQKYLDKKGYSVKAMQSINIFTVGGTLSVNAHGVAHDPGQIAPTVKSMRVMTADGHVVVASPTMNRELFSHVLGGYGLFGVILDVDLEVVPNEVYKWSTTYMDYTEFPEFFKKNVDKNPNYGLMYGRISLSPGTYLEETAVHTFEKVEWNEPLPELIFPKLTWLNRLVINFSKTGSLGRWLRWFLEKNVEHRIHTCVSRNEAMSQNEVCNVSRNQEMYDAMGYLKNRLRDTDILQEYFIPAENMTQFIDGLRETVKKNNANLLNVTIRIVHKDTVTALPYAKGDRFAFVLYFNQKLNEKEAKILQKTTVDLIDVATRAGGTFYLPYQLYYSPEQLRAAYPEVDAFFAKKKAYDPSEIFVNKWYNKYSKE